MSEVMPRVNSEPQEVNAIEFASKLQRIQRESQPGGEMDQQREQVERISEKDEEQLRLIQCEISTLELQNIELSAEFDDIRQRMDALDDELINSSDNESDEEISEDSREVVLRERRKTVRLNLRKNMARLKVLQAQKDVFISRSEPVVKREAYLSTRAEKIKKAKVLVALANTALSDLGDLEEISEELLRPFVPDHIIEDNDPDHFRTIAMIDYREKHDGPIKSIHVPLPEKETPIIDYDYSPIEIFAKPNTNPPARITIDPKKLEILEA